MSRRPAVLVLLLVLTGVAAGPATAAPKAKPCKGGLGAARCLKAARGALPVAVTAKGVIPKAAALQAYVAAVGPLPGVKRVAGATGTLRSGSGPARWVQAYLPTLTSKQRAAVRRTLNAKPRVRAALSTSGRMQWQGWLQDAKDKLGTRFATGLTKTISAEFAPTPNANPKVLAMALPTEDVCRVVVYPAAYEAQDEDLKVVTAAHEIAHCFQHQFGTSTWGVPGRQWWVEGGAEWAGDVVATEMLGRPPSTAASGEPWTTWLKTPGTGTLGRTYDAVGFWAQLEQVTGAAFARMRSDAVEEDGAQLYRDVTANADAYFSTLGTTYFREAGLGPGFDLTGPGITAARPAPVALDLAAGQARTLTAGPRAAALATVGTAADIVTTAPSGPLAGTLRTADGEREDAAVGRTWCARSGGCACPGGSPGEPAAAILPRWPDGSARLGISSRGAQAAALKLTATTLEQFCGKPQPGRLEVEGAIRATGTEIGSCWLGLLDFPLNCAMTTTTPAGKRVVVNVALTPGASYGGAGYYAADSYLKSSGPGVLPIELRTVPGGLVSAVVPGGGNSGWSTYATNEHGDGGFALGAFSGGSVAGAVNARLKWVDEGEKTTVDVTGTFTAMLR